MVSTFTANEVATTSFISVTQLTEEAQKKVIRTFTSFDTSNLTGSNFFCNLQTEALTVSSTMDIVIRSKNDALGTTLSNPSAKVNFEAFDTGATFEGRFTITNAGTYLWDSNCVNLNQSGNTDVRIASVNEGDAPSVIFSTRMASIRHPTTSFRPLLQLRQGTAITPSEAFTPITASTPISAFTPSENYTDTLNPRINGQILVDVDPSDPPSEEDGTTS